MTTFKKLLLPFTAVLVLAWAGLVLAQNSPGGAFLTNYDYILDTPNGWLWRTLTPWRIEGATDDAFETTITFAEPTADRTLTFANATGNVALTGSAATAGIRAGTMTLDGANPSSVATGLSALTACTVFAQRSTTPSLTFVTFTTLLTATAGQLDVYAWAPTSASDPTLVASTAADVLYYVCSGTP